MKRRTTPTLEVQIEGINNVDVTSIAFMFKQDPLETCTVKVCKNYPSQVTYDSTKNVYLIPFDSSDTCIFNENEFFWMDTRIVLTNNKVPETSLVKIKMHKTLFSSTEI